MEDYCYDKIGVMMKIQFYNKTSVMIKIQYYLYE